MKKLAGILLLSILTGGLASAQFIQFGIRGGLNYSTLNFADVENIVSGVNEYDLASDEAFQGFHIGVMTRFKIFSFYLQPELMFNTAGGKVLVEDISGGTNYEEVKSIKYSKIDLPVMLGYKLGPLRLNVGPVASVILSEESGLEDIIPELETISKSASIGYQAGAGLDLFKIITLDYRYEGGLSKWGEKVTVGGNDFNFDTRNRMHLISLGILF